MSEPSFVKETVANGGRLVPLTLSKDQSLGLGVMNPSIGIDGDGDLLINLRSVNYAFYNIEESQKFPSRWGPLNYMHPEDDLTLQTRNFVGRLNNDYQIENISLVDTSGFDKDPVWSFHGLEDARVVHWGGKLFLTGVRRDTKPDGQGRMELSEISIDKLSWKVTEIGRSRIPAPVDETSYCEKNWMPIIGRDFHYVKWSSPTEVVKASLGKETTCEQTSIEAGIRPPADQRGSSHVVPWRGLWIAITHEVDLTKNYLKQKNAVYRHRLCVWDKNFKLIGLTGKFNFLSSRVEFACGAVALEDKLIVTFGFQDSTAFLLEVPASYIDSLIDRCLVNA
jgi:hypothetical protein